MAAYNWINIDAMCPSCNKVVSIRCQTHIASDFGGDENGRFLHREYQLGDKMAWWPEDHKRFLNWREEWRGDSGNLQSDQAVEACYAYCENCEAKLCVVIQFENLRPVEVIRITLEEDWPDGYSA